MTPHRPACWHIPQQSQAEGKLLTQDPTHRRGSFSLARALQESGRTEEAIAAWEAYLRLDDSSSWAETARRNLGILRGD